MAKENIGGQALPDGVLFRNKEWVSIARRQKDQIILEVYPTMKMTGWRKVLANIPVLRGILAFILIFLAFLQTVFEKSEKRDKEFWFKMGKRVAFIFLILLVLPFLLELFFLPFGYYGQFLFLDQQIPIARQVVEKFSTYLLVILSFSFLVNIFYPSLFAYHGAEHKCIMAYESGKELVLQKALVSSRLHPRCGTSFFVIIAILDSIFLTPFLAYYRLSYDVFWQLFLIGLGYEVSIYVNSHCSSLLSRVLRPLGLLLQRITTREPTPAQLEVALAALRALPK